MMVSKASRLRSTSMRKVHVLLFLFFFVFTSSSAFAVDDSTRTKRFPSYQSLNAAYIFGGQVYNDDFFYDPGFSLQFSMGKKLHKDLSVGLGLAYMPLTSENFIPIYAEVIGMKKKKKNTPFIRFQGGYSYGWKGSHAVDEDYEIDGGIFFSAGMGRRIKISDNYSVLFHWSYAHQFARMEYDVFGSKPYSTLLNYDMLQITIGLVFE